MRRLLPLTILALTLGLAGCQSTATYTPEYVNAATVPGSEQVEGKALLYFDDAYVGYVFNEGASTFTGSGAKLSVPLGLMTREIAKTVYGAAFRDGVDVSSVAANEPGYRVVLEPTVADFKYYYHQAENLGFAITPGAEMVLQLKVRDPAGIELSSRTYRSGERKAGAYMMSLSPEDKISRLAHEIMADLMRQSLDDIRASLPSPSPP